MMASDIIPPFAADNFRSYQWRGYGTTSNIQFQPGFETQLMGRPSVKPQPHRPMPTFCAQSRPKFLRLDSAGETIDSCHSPETCKTPEVSHSKLYQHKNSFDSKSKRSNRNRVCGESLPKARRTTGTCNFPSSESKKSIDSEELEQLATKFSSCFTGGRSNPINTSSGLQSDSDPKSNIKMAGPSNNDCHQFWQPNNPYSPCATSNMNCTQFTDFQSGPPRFYPPPPSRARRTQSYMGMPISMMNFRPHPFMHPPQRWGNPQLPFTPPVDFPPWAFNNYVPLMQKDMNPPVVNVPQPVAHFGIPLGAWNGACQQNHQGTKQNRCPTYSSRKKNTRLPRNNHRTVTKILQRPQPIVESEPSDHAISTVQEVKLIPSHNSHSNDVINGSVPESQANFSVKESDTSCEHRRIPTIPSGDIHKSNESATKQRHSSIDFVLGGLKPSPDNLSDSDFVDCDWDALDDRSSHDKPWADCFVNNDPYNPLTGWRCRKRSPLDDLHQDSDQSVTRGSSASIAHPSDRQEYDSGTESGSEGNSSEEELEDISDQPTQRLKGNEQAVNNSCDINTPDPTLGVEVHHAPDKFEDTSKDSAPESKQSSQPFAVGKTPETENDASRRQKCLHPSISYVLGGFEDQHAQDDGSDSDDWDDFSDSDDETYSAGGFASEFTSELNRDALGPFQFTSPCSSGPQVVGVGRAEASPGQKITSPSAPCGPIFKPKARTVLISQRIICQVSDRPVSMVVPLEPSGRMSQNLMPTIQVGFSSPRLPCASIVSCMSMGKPRSTSSTKITKQVHFSNKATLIVCPEPSDIIHEIRQTRRGPWLDYARDRCRFQHRITHLERVIGPHLSLEHREKVAQRMKQTMDVGAPLAKYEVPDKSPV